MNERLSLLGILWLFYVSGSHGCPQSCACNPESLKATCRDLEALNTFPDYIQHLEVRNYKSKGFTLPENYFLNLGLQNVTSIKIVNSSLISVHKSAFNGLTSLRDVILSNNKIRSIDPTTFQFNTNLKAVLLGGNPLKFSFSGEFANASVLESESLETLFLDSCKLMEIPSFDSLKNIEHVNLRKNRIKKVSANAFYQLEFLEEINLSDNFIDSIDSEAFSTISELSTLNLARNPITELTNLDVEGLQALDVSGGKLHKLNEDFFKGLLDLSTLNVSSNLISSIDADTFSGLTKLMYIDLSNNLFNSLPMTLFENNRKLEKISLSGNNLLKNLPTFNGHFFYLQYYDVSGCDVTEVSPSSFSSFKYLTTLNISNNEISNLERSSFSELKSIRVMDLSNNKIKFFPTNIFEENHELTKLYLKGNLFHQIPVATFEETPYLFHLDLSNNQISELWSETDIEVMVNSKTFSNLAFLGLSGNRLESIDKRHFQPLVSLRTISLENNRFSCNDEFINLISWLYTEKFIVRVNENNEEIGQVAQYPKADPRSIASELCNGKGNSKPIKEAIPRLREELSRDVGLQQEGDWDDGAVSQESNPYSKSTPSSALFGPITLIFITVATTCFAFGNIVLLLVLRKKRRMKQYQIPPTPLYSDRRVLLPLDEMSQSYAMS